LIGVRLDVGPALVGQGEDAATAGALGGDQALVLEQLQRRVHRPRARPPRAVGARRNLLDQLVAVPGPALFLREQVEDGGPDFALAAPPAATEPTPAPRALGPAGATREARATGEPGTARATG